MRAGSTPARSSPMGVFVSSVSTSMMSPDSTRSAGAAPAQYYPYATVDGVASSRCVHGAWVCAASMATHAAALPAATIVTAILQRRILLRHFPDGGNATDRRRLTKRLLEYGVRNLRFTLHDA